MGFETISAPGGNLASAALVLPDRHNTAPSQSTVSLAGGILTVTTAPPVSTAAQTALAGLAPLDHPVPESPLPPARPTPFTFHDPAAIGPAPADPFGFDPTLPPPPAWLPKSPA